ncbi:MAG: DUF748 domain-containing protein [Syntrophales bacterium]
MKKFMLLKPWQIKTILAITAVFILYSLIGFFILPPVFKSLLLDKIEGETGRKASIDKIRTNPYTLSVRISGLVIRERNGRDVFASIEDFFIKPGISSIYKGALIVKELTVTQPYIKVIRTKEGEYNFSDLLKKRREKEPERESALPLFSINNIQLLQGRIDISDLAKNMEHKITDIDIKLPFISNTRADVDVWITPLLAARINESYFYFGGKSKPFSPEQESMLDIDVKEIHIPRYFSYAPAELNFRIPEGFLDGRVTVIFSRPPGQTPALKITGVIFLKKLKIVDPDNKDILFLPGLDINISSFEPFSRKLRLSSILLRAPVVNIWRDKNGQWNPLPPKTRKKAAAEREYFFHADDARITDGRIIFTDYAKNGFRTSIDSLHLSLVNIASAPAEKTDIQMTGSISSGGEITVRGSLCLVAPPGKKPDESSQVADLNVLLKNVGVAPFQAYSPRGAKVRLTRGSLTGKGKLLLSHSKKNGMNAVYKGDILLSDFSSMDEMEKKEFFKWKKIDLKEILADSGSARLEIGNISVDNLYGHVRISPEGKLNIITMLAGTDEKRDRGAALAAQEIPKKAVPFKTLKIDTVSIADSRVDFSDFHVKPPFRSNLENLRGTITDLSSKENSQAKINITGSVGKYSKIDIRGTTGPILQSAFLLDLSLDAQDIDMTRFTPYASKYIGYTISKGKAFLRLKYQVIQPRLEADNNLRFNQLTLGRQVPSPEATTLPVKFVLSILKDREGNIEADIPVKGNIDDPAFDLGGVIRTAFGNFIAKIASAPFAFLGSMFGGGEELSYVEFDYGSDILSAESAGKVDKISKILYDRPELQLELAGYVDMEQDTEALKMNRLQAMLKEKKREDLEKKGGRAPAGSLTLSPEESLAYLKKVHKEKFPEMYIGDLSVQALRANLLSKIHIGEQDLRRLARSRARQVEDRIMNSGRVKPERIFILSPDSLTLEGAVTGKRSRVVLSLK